MRLLLQKISRSYKGSFAAIANSQSSVFDGGFRCLGWRERDGHAAQKGAGSKKDDKSGGKEEAIVLVARQK